MGLRVEPIGREALMPEAGEQVTCWNCRCLFRVEQRVGKATCPGCGSLVAVHRLQLPSMPSRKPESAEQLEPEVQLPRWGQDQEEEQVEPARQVQGEEVIVLLADEKKSAPERPARPAVAKPAPVRESERRIRSLRRELFSERQGVLPELEPGSESGWWVRVVMAMVGVFFAGLLLLALAMSLQAG